MLWTLFDSLFSFLFRCVSITRTRCVSNRSYWKNTAVFQDISKKNLYVSELSWKTFHWRIYITLLDLLFLSVIVCWMIWDYWRKLTFIFVFCSVYIFNIHGCYKAGKISWRLWWAYNNWTISEITKYWISTFLL